MRALLSFIRLSLGLTGSQADYLMGLIGTTVMVVANGKRLARALSMASNGT